eukprot:772426-Rhodomonas_salina.1
MALPTLTSKNPCRSVLGVEHTSNPLVPIPSHSECKERGMGEKCGLGPPSHDAFRRPSKPQPLGRRGGQERMGSGYCLRSGTEGEGTSRECSGERKEGEEPPFFSAMMQEKED